MRSFGLRFSTGQSLVVASLAPIIILLFLNMGYTWLGITLVVLSAAVVVVSFRGRRLTGWVAAVFAWLWRRRKPVEPPSEPVVGATVKPGDHVAVRWQGDFLIAVIELLPRPFTPTVIVDGQVHTDNVLDTELVERLLSVLCPDLEADIVSAGHRVGKTASAEVVSLYEQIIGRDPAPVHRRTWIMLRGDPVRTRKSAQRRDVDVAGLARYLVASATRLADQLASNGVDAVCARSFDDFDRATDIGFEKEGWSKIAGREGYTAAYAAPGGPNVWWSAPADHIITRVRVACGAAPRSTILLTTPGKPTKLPGFIRLLGAQRAGLEGRQSLIADRHGRLPIGSAGVLLGATPRGFPVYMPFDDVDVSIDLSDSNTFVQFVLRAAAGGGVVTLGPQFQELAGLLGAHLGAEGAESKVVWPNATTYLGPHPGIDRVILQPDFIGTPRHRQLPIRPISPPEEERYHNAASSMIMAAAEGR
ncbi:MAG: type VII secretion protein EccE [Mycobacteriaceae bacterium]|nr:type VII secretion protein EccE [Mycobacteriaceae bacterium]